VWINRPKPRATEEACRTIAHEDAVSFGEEYAILDLGEAPG
jgi:hypothetical protein